MPGRVAPTRPAHGNQVRAEWTRAQVIVDTIRERRLLGDLVSNYLDGAGASIP